MKNATFSQFRNNAKSFFDAVEAGETVQVFRHGRPVALVTPVEGSAAEDSEYWSHRRGPVKVKGVRLSQLVLQERGSARA